MQTSIVDKYIRKLGDNLIGAYKQGSTVTGYADEYSDIDYSVVWMEKFPECSLRKKLGNSLSYKYLYCGDSSHKGTDRFGYDNNSFNIAHQLDFNFFSIYDEIQTTKINEHKLYILGGFVKGEIIYEKDSMLSNYKDKLVITDSIVNMYKEVSRGPIQNNINSLEIAIKRKSIVESMKCLSYLLQNFGIHLYLENKMFPSSPKWLQKDAKKYGWNTDFIQMANNLGESIGNDIDVKVLREMAGKIC